MQTYTQAVAEVRAHIDGLMRAGIDLDAAADDYVNYGIEKGANSRGEMSAEIRGSDSVSGHPIPITFEAVDD